MSSSSTTQHEAYDIYRAARGDAAPLVVLCEHASQALPGGYAWSAADRWLRETHWAWDPGSRELAVELADEVGADALLARFSRLLIDANRPEDSQGLFRTVVEGQEPVRLNEALSRGERAARLERFYRPYHWAADALVAQHPAAWVLSVHTFTPLYEGQRRDVQVGVLYDKEVARGEALHSLLQDGRHDVRRNEPWSGADGLMFSAAVHGDAHGRVALELEVRQDLATDAAWRRDFVPRLGHALMSLWNAP
jgi:predicted N-formylglutamate amidohydrolase